MKYTIKLLISITLVFLIGLLFTADSYAEERLPTYVRGESSSSGYLLPGVVKKDALADRFESYMEAQTELEEQLEAYGEIETMSVMTQQVGEFEINSDLFQGSSGGMEEIGGDRDEAAAELNTDTATDVIAGDPESIDPSDGGKLSTAR